MHVISLRLLRAFWERHPRSETSLRAWYQVVRHANGSSLGDLQQTYPTADQVERLTVFSIGGNEFRLVARVEYQRQEVYVRAVLTHAEYEREAWKRDPWFRHG
jgi:mRNA interferase HigB